MHSKSIFLGVCVITWVAFQCCFLQLFVISIEVRSQSTLLGTDILASVTFLLSLVLHQSLLCGSYVFLSDHLNSHSSHWTSWSFIFFWWTFMFSEHRYLQIYIFIIFVFTLGSQILTGISGVGSRQNNQGWNINSFSPQDGFPKSPTLHQLTCPYHPSCVRGGAV